MSVPTLFRSFSIIAIVTIVSKILGLIRDQMIAYAYGASVVSDAYFYAFQIPSFSLILLGGLGGPFHTATVSVLSKLIKGQELPSEEVQRLTNTFITATGVVFTLLSVLAFIFAPQVIEVIAHRATPTMKHLATVQLQWMSPIILMGGIIGILYGVANVYHKFFWPSLSPAAVNVVLIVLLMFMGPDKQGMILAISTLLGALLQVILQVPDFFKLGFQYKPTFDLHIPDLKTMGELLFPAAIGTSIGQMNIYVAMFFVSQLTSGGWTAIVLGNRLIQLPIGVLIIAMLVPLFPRFSRMVADQDYDSLRSSFRDGILSLWMLSFPCIALILLLGNAAVALLFQRGQFTAENTWLVNSVLVVLSFSMIPYMLRDGITRVFYAFNDSRTPLIVGIVSIGVNAFFNAILVGPFKVIGISLSTLIVTFVNAILLSVLVRKHIPDLGLRHLFGPALKMMLATGMIYAAGYYMLGWLHQGYHMMHLTNAHLQTISDILILTLLMSVLYIWILLYMKEPLAHSIYNRISSRFIRRAQA